MQFCEIAIEFLQVSSHRVIKGKSFEKLLITLTLKNWNRNGKKQRFVLFFKTFVLQNKEGVTGVIYK